MRTNEIINEYYDPSEDDAVVRTKQDVRRPRLTLMHLNKMKKTRELRRMEAGKRVRNIPKIYAAPPPQM